MSRVVAVTAVGLLDALANDITEAEAGGQAAHASMLRDMRTSVADAPPSLRAFTYATHDGTIRDFRIVTAVSETALAAANRDIQVLGKWRMLLAGWQLGTRPDTDPECQAVRDHRELTMILRAELTALMSLLIDRGVFDQEEWTVAVGNAAAALSSDYERRWPGVTANEIGLNINPVTAAPWMSRWRR